MRLEVKQFNTDTGKWKAIDANEFIGKSVMEYMINTKDRIIGGLYEGENKKPTLFICNNEKDLDNYKDKGVCVSIQDLEKILNTESVPKVVLDVFPDATFTATEVAQ